MRMRRILAAVIATAALAGLGLTGAAAAVAAPNTAVTESLTPGECTDAGGKVVGMYCQGGTKDGQMVD
ncbi:hypothetical protein DEJ51_26680 [Streptomyces venezuelae]|uniref:Secreted protein n=1 Tax=Streptomyces venezuelae TaxID=54571 RepID=A0A5P2DQ66_STRVZ|nr:hypothetical protein [Streptomyces venezuelae]QES57324.1 hypothetical protein DEJ51_26680 [Streptomyces venezuelae]